MLAVTHDRYGPPDVLKLETVPDPTIADDQILVDVFAFSVTTADWRMRASAFPAGLWLIGRLISGLRSPRHPLTSREFSGRVAAVGRKVTRFKVGDNVFGISDTGVSAERIAVPESAVVLPKPERLTHAEAAALPFGGLTAVEFARDYARVAAGERVLVLGGSGGVGVYLVQIAVHLGAEVTAVASTDNLPLLRALGAHHVVDYTTEDPRRDGIKYDVIFDTIGASTFAGYRNHLTSTGRHAFIEANLREMGQALITPWLPGPTVKFGVSIESIKSLQGLVDLVEAEAIRPVIGHRFGLSGTVDAHRVVDGRRRKGAVIVEVRPEPVARVVQVA